MLLTDLRTRARRRRAADRLAIAAPAAVCGIAVGVAVEYFADPSAGRRRRHSVRDRALSRMRRGERRAARRARRAGSDAVGLARRTVNARPRRREQLDDTTLAHKVESEFYRRTGVPKEGVSINVEDGIVFLRGVMDRREDIERIDAGTRRIAGVRGVENLLHTPGTPAPASRPKPARARR
jgi:BON domain